MSAMSTISAATILIITTSMLIITTIVESHDVNNMQSSNITNNNYNSVDPDISLVNITSIGSVIMSEVNIKDNKAIQYLIFDNGRTALFSCILDGNVLLNTVEISNNIVDDILINVNGITDLSMNGLHFISVGNGNVQVNDGESLASFDGLNNLNVYTCNMFTNDDDYLFKVTLGDIKFNECHIDKSDIDESIVCIKGDSESADDELLDDGQIISADGVNTNDMQIKIDTFVNGLNDPLHIINFVDSLLDNNYLEGDGFTSELINENISGDYLKGNEMKATVYLFAFM